MTASKLPEWPEKPANLWDDAAWTLYHAKRAEAALARMEALVEYAQHTGAWCGQNMGHACTCGLDALLSGRGEGQADG